MVNLTTRQQHVLNILINFQREHGYPPTNTELSGLLGCSSPNAAADHLRALERKGAITLTRGVSRGIAINDLENVADVDSLLHALVNDEDGAKDRAISYLKNKGIPV
ncbi:LexA family protein [Citrobacter farmeri]|uniref:LexA family protein n=1 Tax=Citrobacter farmeri TaxID=67824 RepID=UPI0021AC56D1|nr:LexA family transcriptional regulator [Citrobacter farmeri]EMB4691997.1 LexA family transcriptional regulator [Citrobacter farmeri]